MNSSNHAMCEEEAAALMVNVRCHSYKQKWEDEKAAATESAPASDRALNQNTHKGPGHRFAKGASGSRTATASSAERGKGRSEAVQEAERRAAATSEAVDADVLRHRRREASCAGQGLASGGGTAEDFRELRNERLQRVNEALVKRAQGPPRRRSRSPRGGVAAIGSRPARIPIVRAPRPATPSTGRQANPSTASSTDSVDVGNVMSAINAIGKAAATITIGDGDGDVGAHARDTHIRVPRVTAHRLNEALLLAGQSSKQMRDALEVYEKAARKNETFIEIAQQALSHAIAD